MSSGLLDAVFLAGFVSFGVGIYLAFGLGASLASAGAILMLAATAGALKK